MDCNSNRFDIQNTLSTNKNCDVFIVMDKSNSDLLLLKSLKMGSNENISNKIRFSREIEIVSTLDHPNIAQPILTHVDANSFYIFYPYLKGNTLSEIITNAKFLSEKDALKICIQLLEALEYIHNRGLIHCDVNPNNIYISEAYGVKLLDFGLSLTVEEAEQVASGSIIGTIPFMAPEQMGFTDFKIDSRTDLFCTAIILYKLLSGNHPFETNGNSLKLLLNAELKKELQPIKQVTSTLNEILLKALEPTPDYRYQTATGFRNDLVLVLEELNGNQKILSIGKADAVASVNRSKLFVARTNEIEYLNKGLLQLTKSKQSSLLMYGRSGIGKTEIVKQFKHQINRADFNFVSVKSNRFSPHQPYSIFRQIILELISDLKKLPNHIIDDFSKKLNGALSEQTGVILKIIPELGVFFEKGTSIDTIEPDKEADRISYVLAELFKLFCKIKKTIFFVDDLQWVDKITFKILKNILNEKTPCMLIINFRTEKDEEEPYVFGYKLTEIGIDKICPINRFNKSEVKELVYNRFGDVKSIDELADTIAERTDGNPFVISEAIRFLVNNEFIIKENSGWVFSRDMLKSLPSRFDTLSLLLGKVDQLSSQNRDVLEIISLLEGKLDIKIIENVVEKSREGLNSSLRRLEELGFITSDFRDGYLFTHDKIQESIRSGIEKRRKYYLYAKIGDVYHSFLDLQKDFLFNAAESYLKSDCYEKAITISFEAAKYAIEKVAHDIAIRYFKNIEILITRYDSNQGRIPINMVLAETLFADVLMLTGKNEQALKIYNKVIKQYTLSKNEIIIIKYKIGSLFHNIGDFEKSSNHFYSLLSELGIKVPKRKSTVMVLLSFEIILQFFFSIGFKRFVPKTTIGLKILKLQIFQKLSYSLYFYNMVTAFYFHFKALNIADTVTDCFEKFSLYSSHQVPIYQVLFKKRSLKYYLKSLNIARSINRKDCFPFAEQMRGLVCYFEGMWAESEKKLKASIANFQSIGDIAGQILSSEHVWKISLKKGTLAIAQSDMEITLKKCKIVNDKYYEIVTQSALQVTKFLRQSRFDEIECNSLNEKHRNVSTFLYKIEVGSYLIQLDLLNNKFGSAYPKLIELLDLINLKSFNAEYNVPSFCFLGEILNLELHNRNKNSLKTLPLTKFQLHSKNINNLIKLYFSCFTFPAYRGFFRRNLASYFAAIGLKTISRYLFNKSIQAHHSLDMRYEEAKSLRDYANFLEEFCNKPGDARDKYNEAYRLFSWCGAKLEMDRIETKVDPWIKDQCKPAEKVDNVRRPDETTVVANSSIAHGVNQIRLNTLFELSTSMNSIDNLDELMRQILKAMLDATGAQFAHLLLEPGKNHDGKKIFINDSGQVAVSKNKMVNTSLVEQARQVGKTVILRDAFAEALTQDTKHLRSQMCVPLYRGDQYLGAIYLANEKVGGLFTDDSAKTAHIIATQAAVLLENAYLLDEYKRFNRNLDKKVKEQTQDISEKNKQLENANLKLIETERMKNLLSGTLVHDIKNYAAGIEGNLRILGLKHQEDQKLLSTVTIVTEACEDIVSLASNILDIGKMDEGKLTLNLSMIDHYSLKLIVDKYVGTSVFEEKQITIKVDQPINNFDIEADTYLLERVFQNILSNASKYVPRDGEMRISFIDNNKENIICFYNSGTPIPEEQKEALFEKYTRLENKQSRYSKGLGLFFCKMVMTAHKGKIWVDTNETGNYFKLSFKKPLTNVVALRVAS